MSEVEPARPKLVGFWVAVALLSVAGLPFSAAAVVMFELGGVVCDAHPDRFICTDAGQLCAFALPCAAWGIAVFVSISGGVVARRRCRKEVANASLTVAASVYGVVMLSAAGVSLG